MLKIIGSPNVVGNTTVFKVWKTKTSSTFTFMKTEYSVDRYINRLRANCEKLEIRPSTKLEQLKVLRKWYLITSLEIVSRDTFGLFSKQMSLFVHLA